MVRAPRQVRPVARTGAVELDLRDALARSPACPSDALDAEHVLFAIVQLPRRDETTQAQTCVTGQHAEDASDAGAENHLCPVSRKPPPVGDVAVVVLACTSGPLAPSVIAMPAMSPRASPKGRAKPS